MDLSKLALLSTDALQKMQEAIKGVLAARLDTTPRPGRRATFDDGRGNVRTITIERINSKTVTGVEAGNSVEPGKRWRVGFSSLRVEAVERKVPNPSQPMKLHQTHRPASYGGDAW